jgi:hypothetical protein
VLQDTGSFEQSSSHFINYDNVLGNDYLQVLRRGDTIYFDGKPGTPASMDLLSGLLPLDKDALPHAQHEVHGVLYHPIIAEANVVLVGNTQRCLRKTGTWGDRLALRHYKRQRDSRQAPP